MRYEKHQSNREPEWCLIRVGTRGTKCLGIPLISLKVCNWKDCKYRTIIPCANHRCNKIACDKKHSCLICVECAKKKVETLSILQERRKCKQVMCKVFKHCKSLTQIRCGVYGCEKPVCDLHREKLCSDCCFNLKSQLNKKKYELCVMVLWIILFLLWNWVSLFTTSLKL